MAYLDAASSEPLHPAARAALLAALDDGWADPARLHGEGRRARLLLDQARQQVAAVLGCRADELAFTASGTQAVHLAVLGTVAARRRRAGAGQPRPALVASAVEHSSVLHAIGQCERDGAETAIAGVDRRGRADPGEFAALLHAAPPAPQRSAPAPRARGAVLACLQSANPEVGTIQPVEEVASACRQAGVPLLVDAAASAGRMPIPGGWSLLTASAHKWGGPAGIGVLAVRKGTRWRSPLPEDERENRRVPGYPNVPAALAAAAGLQALDAERLAREAALRALTERIRARVPQVVADSVVYGDPVQRLPHIVTFSCLYVNGEALVTELDRAGFGVSSGSACTADSLRPSHVLEAMGVVTHGNVRVSLPRATNQDTIERFLAVLPGIVARLRGSAGPAVSA